MRRVRRGAAIAAIALVGAGLPAAPGSAHIPPHRAAAPAITFDVTVGLDCVAGTLTREHVVAELRSSDGRLLDRDRSYSQAGEWHACFQRPVRPGYVVTANTADARRTVVVPHFTLHVERVSNLMWGTAPTSGRPVSIAINHCPFDSGCTPVPPIGTAVDAARAFELDASAQLDLGGGDIVVASQTLPSGDVFRREASAAALQFSTSPLSVAVDCPPVGPHWIALHSPSGRLRGLIAFSGTRRCAWTFLHGFVRHGRAVVPRPGDVVTSSIASDVDYVWPNARIRLAAVHRLAGSCLPHAPYTGSVEREGDSIDWSGTTDGDGRWSHREADYDPEVGDRLVLACAWPTGDVIATISHVTQVLGTPRSQP